MPPPTVTVEKVKHGTAVMIEGYGLGGESPVQTIRLIYRIDLLSLIRVPIGILAGIIILVSGFKRLTVKWTKSGNAAARFLEETEAECDEGGWGNQLRSGKEYFERYIWELDRHYIIFMVLLLTASVILLPFVLETGAAFFAVVVCCIGLILWYSVAAIKSFYKLGGVLLRRRIWPGA